MSVVTFFKVTDKEFSQEFETIFRENARMVYRTAYSVTRNPQDSEDVVQTLFLSLMRRGFPEGLKANPQAYLYRAAVNLSITVVRSRGRHVSITETAELPIDAIDTNTADRDLDIQRRLANAMTQLSAGAVEMLILRYEYNYSDAQIAKLLGKSRGAVAVALFRARARLKKLL